MAVAHLPYVLVQWLLGAAAPVAARSGSKTARALAGRQEAGEALRAWGLEHRNPGLPGIWIHAPSVGEGLVARAVLEALAGRRAGLEAVFTHLSPSAEALAAGMPAAWAGYLPWDVPREVARSLDAVRPGAVVFTRTEVWPVLVAEAHRRGVPLAMVGGIVRPGAGRSRWWARAVLRSTWRRLSLACAVTGADADGFARMGVPTSVLQVTGDPGIDSAAARAGGPEVDEPWLVPFVEEPRPTVVAGSTWPSDLRVLLPALDRARRAVPGLRVVVAPHEPTSAVVADIFSDFFASGWRGATLAEVEAVGAGDVDVVVVERMGVLARLYRVADVAYVGGGFHGAGLHSVLEPAAAGVPVLFGPRHANARAAGDLAEVGGGRSVASARALEEALVHWLTDGAAHSYAGGRASGYIHAHRGAAERTAALVDDLLNPPADSA
jgi:3-deoxy-D-manno-octulosonic-acid transferase